MLTGHAGRRAVLEGGNDDPKWREWMRAAQAGDGDAYARLLREIAPLIRGRVRRDLGGRAGDDVEDVVQEILLSLHAARRTYDPDRPFLPWVLAIARRRCTDALRRRYRSAAREVAIETDNETFSQALANSSDGVTEAAALRRAVAGLPDSQRRAVEMLKLGEMSLKQASAASGVSVAALKVASHRAVKALRAALGGKGVGRGKNMGEKGADG
jgi:RNA polymerase sigma-70 factor (ECF subfamily)